MVNSRNKKIWNWIARLGLAAQAGFLGGIVAGVALPLTLAAYAINGTAGVTAAVAAACVCLLGGEVALAMGDLLARRFDRFYALLAGMLARMGLPLLFGIGLHLVIPSLTRAGLFIYFLLYYVVVLAAETIVAVAQVSDDSTSGKAI